MEALDSDRILPNWFCFNAKHTRSSIVIRWVFRISSFELTSYLGMIEQYSP